MKQETSAGIIIYRRDPVTNEYLYLVLHYLSGHWDFAKGKLEGSETKREAAVRELKEETSLNASLYDNFEQSLSYIFRNRKGELVEKQVTFFVGETDSQAVTLSREHIGYKWLSFEQALQQLTYTNARQVLTKAHDFIGQQK